MEKEAKRANPMIMLKLRWERLMAFVICVRKRGTKRISVRPKIMQHDCWEKEENKHKRPNNFKPKASIKGSEQGNVTVNENSGSVELLLMCLDLSRETCGNCLVDCDVVLCDNDEEGPWDLCFDNGDEVVDCLCVTEKVMNETMMCVENFLRERGPADFLA